MTALLVSLRLRHQILDARISAALRRPKPDELEIRTMKKQKLQLKEKIALLEKRQEGVGGTLISRSLLPPRTA